MLLLLAACSQYALHSNEKSAAEPDTASGSVVIADTLPDDTAPPVVDEDCNGVDDDGDGLVDEDYPDHDADGQADCIDDTCAIAAEDAVAGSWSCLAGTPTVTDPWDVVVATQFAPPWVGAPSLYVSPTSTPLVQELTDDNGDGVIDGDDDLDMLVVWSDSHGGRVARFDVQTGALEQEYDADVGYGGAPAVGDVDGDGEPELLWWGSDNSLHVVHVDGTAVWSTGPLTSFLGGMAAVSLADLDHDGTVEVIDGIDVRDGADGTLRATLAAPEPIWWSPPVAADLDLDGVDEILQEGGIYRADGTAILTGPKTNGDLYWAVPVQADADAEGEVLFLHGGTWELVDTDGTTLSTVKIGGGVLGAPAVGDLDGDGAMEVVFPQQTALHAYSLDGVERWSQPITDTSSAAGVSLADLDGDGRAEVLYGDEQSFTIRDGCDGSVLYGSTEHVSGTMLEYPVVVDVDHDGSAEVLVMSDSTAGWAGDVVLDHAGAGWTAAPTSWPTYDFRDGGADASGTPVDDGQAWAETPTLRALATGAAPTQDAAVVAGETCAAGCDADHDVQVAVFVENAGAGTLAAGVEVVLSRDDAGVLTEVARAATAAAVLPGGRSESLVFALTGADVGTDGLVAALAAPPDGDTDTSNDRVGLTVGCE